MAAPRHEDSPRTIPDVLHRGDVISLAKDFRQTDHVVAIDRNPSTSKSTIFRRNLETGKLGEIR